MKNSEYFRGESGEGRGTIDAGRSLQAFFGEAQSIEINGERLVPDKTKGYIEFFLAHGFPMITRRRKTLHSGTVARSYQSMRHQGLNFEHIVKQYVEENNRILGDDKKIAGDKYIGGIVGVEFVQNGRRISHPENMRWDLTSLEDAPGMRCVASVFKQANGVNRFIGEHMTGRHEWTVSLEVDYEIEKSGVVVLPPLETANGSNKREMPKEFASYLSKSTPEDFAKAGMYYVGVDEVPEEIARCYDPKQEQFTKEFYGRGLVLMMGGLNGDVHFKGTGVVRYGAEPTAAIGQLLASESEPTDWDGIVREMERQVKVLTGCSGTGE